MEKQNAISVSILVKKDHILLLESEHKGENGRELEEEDDGWRNHNFIRNMDL